MTAVTRRILPFAAILALTVTVSVWITAAAAPPASRGQVLTIMHFKSVPISQHLGANGATTKDPTGGAFQEVLKLMSDGKQIGRAFLIDTFVNKAGWSVADISAQFRSRGRVELQGSIPPSGPDTYVITGGTGIFSGARGVAVGRKNNVTVTFQ